MKPMKLERAETSRPAVTGELARPAASADRGAPLGAYPQVRMRRNRKSPWSRRLVAENVLTTSDLIWPIFLVDSGDARSPVAPMPGVSNPT